MHKAVLLLAGVALLLLVTGGIPQTVVGGVGQTGLDASYDVRLVSLYDYSHPYLYHPDERAQVDEFELEVNGIKAGCFYTESGVLSRIVKLGDKTFSISTTNQNPETFNLKCASLSYASGENAFFSGMGVTVIPGPQGTGTIKGYDVKVGAPKDARLALNKLDCPRDVNSETIYAQTFDGSNRLITVQDLKYAVKRFCAGTPALFTLPSGGSYSSSKPYGDLLFYGGFEIPPGETMTLYYIVDGSLLPKFCPEGKVLQEGECVPPTISFDCGAGSYDASTGSCSYKEQTQPSCPIAGTAYDEINKRCVFVLQNEFCPAGNSVLNVTGGLIYCQSCAELGPCQVTSVDANAICASRDAGLVFLDGKCVSNYQTISTPLSLKPGFNAFGVGLPSVDGSLGLLLIIVLLFGVGGYFLITKS